MQTYGIFALSFKTATIKTDNDAGRVLDAKYKFATGVRAERRFMLEHVPVLKGAAQEGGKLRLEVTPMMDGQAFPAVDVPVILRGNITIDEAGDVLVNLRVQFSELENAGLGVDALLMASCCLECTVSNQPTLDEQIRTELKAEEQVKEDVADVLKDTEALLKPAEAAAPNIPLGPDLDVEEDMPFPTDGSDGFGTQPSA
ncbi:hypothetical protein [Deinococcus sp. QL22]|uniref:hypothetical protein n=1 Tax=Deinococcus sp. QL22 TaxID=2939437 RepID=UPI0020180146|nr:hypothetical protein [Deinococcus sp. QL22]UQN06791.1 hypothetical protein M1R55_02385 [Deinococcus sp. QL22]